MTERPNTRKPDLIDNDASAVISLVLTQGGNDSGQPISRSSQIMMVVRDPRTNDTHPSVISVPTGRIPSILFHELALGEWAGERNGASRLFSWGRQSSHAPKLHEPAIYCVKSLMALKLGLGDALERGSVHFDAGVIAVTRGQSHYAKGHRPEVETIAMVTMLVDVREGSDQIPERTASYSVIRWVPVQQFLRSIEQRDPSVVNLDPLELCIHGLCISSAYQVVATSLEEAIRCQ